MRFFSVESDVNMTIQDESTHIAIAYEVKSALAESLAIRRYQGRLTEALSNRTQLIADIMTRKSVSQYITQGTVTVEQLREWANESLNFSVQSTYPTPQPEAGQVGVTLFRAILAEGKFYCFGCRDLYSAELLTGQDTEQERRKAAQDERVLRCERCRKLL